LEIIKKKDKSNGQPPLLSVITIVYNNKQLIESTILSVLNQEYKNIEYIIVDGGSTDGTVKIIKKYKDDIAVLISEPDGGIYDAMNKGIKLATGEWVNFMNAGDAFYSNKTCNIVANEIKTTATDIIYGDFIAINHLNNTELLIKAKPLSAIYKGMIFCHQSVFIKRKLISNYPFDTKYIIAADYNQILSLYHAKAKFYSINTPISRISIHGTSYSNTKTIIEKMKILRSFKPNSLVFLFLIPEFIVSIIRGLLGPKTTEIIRRYKWMYLSK
jgi:glycosyltransferase involved in cell wall biosynthesis